MQDFLHGAVSTDCAVDHHDDAVNQLHPDVNAVLDDDRCGTGTFQYCAGRVADLLNALRIQIGRRLIQEQQARIHGEHACQCKTLFLPTG